VPIAVGTEERGRKPDKATIRRVRQEIGMVFQSFNLFPHLTAKQNIALAPRRVRRLSRAEADALALELLECVGLSDKADEQPSRLSGGRSRSRCARR
jgi:ABC-type polar amino acid transport system ATPase subunit